MAWIITLVEIGAWSLFAMVIVFTARKSVAMRRDLQEVKDKLQVAEKKYAAVLNCNRADFNDKSTLIELTLNLMSQGVAVIRPDSHIWLYNKKAMEFCGVDDMPFPPTYENVFAAQIKNGEFGNNFELMPESMRAYAFERKGKPPRSYIRRRPNGTILEVRSDPMPDGGVIQTYTDVTEMANARAAAEESAAARANFLATISHEMRTPLNGMIGAADLLKGTTLNADQSEYVDMVTCCATSLMGIINDILEFSRLETGDIPVETATFSPVDLLKTACQVIRPALGRKGLVLETQGFDDLPVSMTGDARRIGQIIINYLGNAVKFTETGTITLSASMERDGPRSLWRISVRDTGMGIDPAFHHRLFQPFSQVDMSISRRFGGTGLGLAICQRLADYMDGRVGVESAAGAGSTFWCTIPVGLPDAATGTHPGAAAAPMKEERAWRVLVAEDVVTNQIIMRRTLENLGHQVSVANNGVEALRALAQERFDIVFLDMQMPVMDGIEAARQIRENPLWADLPLIAMTANIFDSDRRACIEAGMNDVLTKPIRMIEIRQFLTTYASAGPRKGVDFMDKERFIKETSMASALPQPPASATPVSPAPPSGASDVTRAA